MNGTSTLHASPSVPGDHLRSWAVGCHLSPMLAFFGLPLGHLLGPLVIWLLKKHESPYLDEQGREALNFHLSITLYFFGLALLGFLPGAALLTLGRPLAALGVAVIVLCGIGLLLLFLVDFVLIIVAAVKTSEGEQFRYPMTIRFF